MKRTYPEKTITSFDGTTIHYLYKKGPKTCVVFLHGLSGQHSAWEPFYTHLHALGHAVLSLDIRGHGFSDKPKETDAYKLNSAVKDIELILKHERISKIILVAHCFGAYLALLLAQKQSTLIEKMLLVSPNYKPGRYWVYTAVFIPYLIALKLLGLIYRKEYYEKIDYVKMRGIRDFDIPKVLYLYKIASIKTMTEFSKEIMKHDFASIAKKISIPTLIISGEKDIIVPVSLGKELQKLLQNAQISIYKNVNHQPTLNDWMKFRTDLVKFVQTR